MLKRTTTRESLAEDDHVRLDVVPLITEHLSGPAKTSLDLVTNQEHVVLLAEFGALCEVSVIRDEDTSLSLNRLNQERSRLLSVSLEGLFQVANVVVANHAAIVVGSNTLKERTKANSALRVGRHGNDTQGPSVEVSVNGQDPGLAIWDLLDLVSPLASELQSSLNSLSTSVHGEHHVESKKFSHALGERSKTH
jgi:hypothetical protein